MIRKKRVSFKEDLVERIPNSFRQGLEVTREVFIIMYEGISFTSRLNLAHRLGHDKKACIHYVIG